MLDIKWIRENIEIFDEAMTKRDCQIRANELIKIDDERKILTTKIQELQNQRNSLAKEIANLKKNGNEAQKEMEDSKKINQELKNIEDNFNQNNHLKAILQTIPNIPENIVPIGKDEKDNKEIEKYGTIKKFDFKPKKHFEIGENLKQLDFEQSAKISGARFSTLYGDLAKLERALSNFMLDVASEFGYQEISPPNLVKDNAMFGSGQLPKFAEEAFKTTSNHWLIPTAEVPLVNLVSKKTIDEDVLPLRFTSYTPCFRSEAGAAGKDTRGMIRQHQFKKVELVSITAADESKKEHERLTNIACETLKRLKLPYRKMLLCTGDMGFTAQKTYDLEVWLPGENKYREISSCSNCGDFQARRLDGKYKSKNGKKPLYLHSLNGSALAVGRTIIAILENYQNEDGSVNVPDALISYMGKNIIS